MSAKMARSASVSPSMSSVRLPIADESTRGSPLNIGCTPVTPSPSSLYQFPFSSTGNGGFSLDSRSRQ